MDGWESTLTGRSQPLPPVISLLHATWRREGGPLEVKNRWLSLARNPETIEYIFGVDSDDEASLQELDGEKVVTGPPSSRSTAVRNWNSAALASSGELLFVIADDYFPERDWDVNLLSAVRAFDPRVHEFVVKVSDSHRHRVAWVQHPVISRRYFERFGLFSQDYFHLYCDNDFSLRATRRAIILDCRELTFHHHHPGELAIAESESQSRGREESQTGRGTFERDHRLFWRIVGPGLVPKSLFGLVSRIPKAGPAIQLLTAIPYIRPNLKREIRRLRKKPVVRRLRRLFATVGRRDT